MVDVREVIEILNAGICWGFELAFSGLGDLFRFWKLGL